jgi:hypothetical protein
MLPTGAPATELRSSLFPILFQPLDVLFSNSLMFEQLPPLLGPDFRVNVALAKMFQDMPEDIQDSQVASYDAPRTAMQQVASALRVLGRRGGELRPASLESVSRRSRIAVESSIAMVEQSTKIFGSLPPYVSRVTGN